MEFKLSCQRRPEAPDTHRAQPAGHHRCRGRVAV